MTRKTLLISALMAASLGLQGCAGGVGLTMLGIGGGTAAGVGVEHTLNGIAYKTFGAPVDQVHAANRKALADMSVRITEDSRTEAGRVIKAAAADREIEIQFERLTPRMTRMRVVANEGALFKDSATATEIILQTVDRLETRTAAAQR